MHHGNDDSFRIGLLRSLGEDDNRKALESAMDELGATGKHPVGKLTPTDEGEIAMMLVTHQGKVVIEFGTSVRWFAMTPQQAISLADGLRQKALGLRRGEARRRRAKRSPIP
jgi:hypothetical protein